MELQDVIRLWNEKQASISLQSASFKTINREILGELSRIHTFIVSFSDEKENDEEGDRLSQWRGYGSDVQGYSLGFNKIRLKEIVCGIKKKWGMNPLFCKCIYDEVDKSRIIGTIFDDFYKTFCEKETEINKSKTDYAALKRIMASFLPQTGLDLMNNSALFKHCGFREENEWRFVFSTTNEASHWDLIHYDEIKERKTPHLKIPLNLTQKERPLDRIVAGPSLWKDQSVANLTIDLKKMGIHGVEVVPSQIPYRNW